MTEGVAIVDFLEQHYLLEGGRRFRAEGWQSEFLDQVGERDEEGRRRFNLALLEVPKFQGKSVTAAGCALYTLCCEGRGRKVAVIANALHQAQSIVFDRLKEAIEINPSLDERFTKHTTRLINRENGSQAVALPCSAASISGRHPDLAIFDEIWKLPDPEVYYQLADMPEVQDPLTLIVTTPGYDWTSLLYGLHERGVKGDDRRMLFFWRTDPKLSSWITDRDVEKWHRKPDAIFQRLHQALWTGGTNAAWTRDQVDACFDAALRPKLTGNRSRHFCGVDIGLRRDRTAAAIVSWSEDGQRLELDDLAVWYPPQGGEVQLTEVESWLATARGRFPGLVIWGDASQFAGSAQRLGNVRQVYFTGGPQGIVRQLSQCLYGLISRGQLRLFEHEELRRELLTVNVRETASGWRLDHESGAHDDTVMSVGLACLAASESVPLTMAQTPPTAKQLAEMEVALSGPSKWDLGMGPRSRWSGARYGRGADTPDGIPY